MKAHGAYADSISCSLRICIPGATVEKMYKMMHPGTFEGGERNFFFLDIKDATASTDDKLECDMTITCLDDYESREEELS